MPITFDTLRLRHKYLLINYGEKTEFELLAVKNKDDYIIKDLNSREVYNLKDLIKYGKGRDYDLIEIETKN